MTSGSIYSIPFVWSAVSSSAAPQDYSRAWLALFQPIKGEDPSHWNGYQLTATSIFSNPAHPIAVGTGVDNPLSYPDRSMPPYWDGFYQVRMFFGSPNKPFDTSPYPAAVIKISGTNWKLVSSTSVGCGVGTATPTEIGRYPASELNTPRMAIPNSKPYIPGQSASSVSKPKAGMGSPPGGRGSSSATSGSGRDAAVAAGTSGASSNDGSLPGWAIAVIVVAAAGGVGTAIAIIRRRRRLAH